MGQLLLGGPGEAFDLPCPTQLDLVRPGFEDIF
jgi:hypothetical protein